MRDLRADLRLCEAATPGPWIVLPERCGPEGQGVYTMGGGPICEVGDPYPRSDNKPEENMRMIAEARMGWPEAIRRAIVAEAKVAELEARLEAAMARALLAEARLREMRG